MHKTHLSWPILPFCDPLTGFTVSMLYVIHSYHEHSRSEQSKLDIINKVPGGMVNITTKVLFAAVMIVK